MPPPASSTGLAAVAAAKSAGSAGSPRSASAEQQLIGEALHSFVDPAGQGPPSRQTSALVTGINWSDRRAAVAPSQLSQLQQLQQQQRIDHAQQSLSSAAYAAAAAASAAASASSSQQLLMGAAGFGRSKSLPYDSSLFAERSASLSALLGERP